MMLVRNNWMEQHHWGKRDCMGNAKHGYSACQQQMPSTSKCPACAIMAKIAIQQVNVQDLPFVNPTKPIACQCKLKI